MVLCALLSGSICKELSWSLSDNTQKKKLTIEDIGLEIFFEGKYYSLNTVPLIWGLPNFLLGVAFLYFNKFTHYA